MLLHAHIYRELAADRARESEALARAAPTRRRPTAPGSTLYARVRAAIAGERASVRPAKALRVQPEPCEPSG